jgi:hypothetical protein
MNARRTNAIFTLRELFQADDGLDYTVPELVLLTGLPLEQVRLALEHFSEANLLYTEIRGVEIYFSLV